jgi:ABC-2 type transport system ATP-binding protein
LHKVSLEIQEGQIQALVGQNGAGKTTLLRLILGLLRPTNGQVRVLGQDPVARRARLMHKIGVVLDGVRALEPRLTGLENLLLKGHFYGMPGSLRQKRATALLCHFELPAGEVVNRYSRGMRQRLVLCIALLHNPTLLLLDEPTLGLDVHARDLLYQALRQATTNGGAVLITSQEISFVERVAEHVTVLEKGGVIAAGKPEEVVAALGYRNQIRLKVSDTRKIRHPLPDGFTLVGEQLQGPLSQAHLEAAVAYLRDTGVGLAGLEQVSGLEQFVKGESR